MDKYIIALFLYKKMKCILFFWKVFSFLSQPESGILADLTIASHGWLKASKEMLAMKFIFCTKYIRIKFRN